MKRNIITLLLITLVPVFVFAGTRGARAEIVNGIAAKVDGDIVTLFELDKEYERARFSAKLMGKEPPARIDVLNDLIDDMLVKREAARRGISVTDNELDEVIKSMKQQNGMTDEQFEKQLQAEQLSMEELRESYRKEILRNRLITALGSAGGNRITEQEVQDFYNAPENEDFFIVPAQVELADIYLPSDPEATMKQAIDLKDKALSLYGKLKNGASFEDLAEAHSQAPNKTEGGFLGSFTRKQLALFLRDPRDIEMIFEQDEGGVVSPIRLADGYHIFKVISRQEQKNLSLQEASDQIKSFLLRKKGQELFTKWLRETRSDSTIQIVLAGSGDSDQGSE